jgi:hypothetical protein
MLDFARQQVNVRRYMGYMGKMGKMAVHDAAQWCALAAKIR